MLEGLTSWCLYLTLKLSHEQRTVNTVWLFFFMVPVPLPSLQGTAWLAISCLGKQCLIWYASHLKGGHHQSQAVIQSQSLMHAALVTTSHHWSEELGNIRPDLSCWVKKTSNLLTLLAICEPVFTTSQYCLSPPPYFRLLLPMYFVSTS